VYVPAGSATSVSADVLIFHPLIYSDSLSVVETEPASPVIEILYIVSKAIAALNTWIFIVPVAASIPVRVIEPLPGPDILYYSVRNKY
jgi:hypothetical protein